MEIGFFAATLELGSCGCNFVVDVGLTPRLFSFRGLIPPADGPCCVQPGPYRRRHYLPTRTIDRLPDTRIHHKESRAVP